MSAGSSPPKAGLAVAAAVVAFAGLAVWFFVQDRAKPAGPKATPASSIGKKVNEADLTTIAISDEAYKKLGIRTAAVERKALKRVRLYGGEVMTPPGQTMTVSAPLTGQIKLEATARPGQRVKQGQPILSLIPILSPDARANLEGLRVDADGQVKSAKTQVDAATIAYNRAKELYLDKAGAQKTVDETQATLDLARKNLEMVEARKALFAKIIGDADAGSIQAIALTAPLDGILKDIHATTGDKVPSNAPLFVVTRLDPVWVRTPVYVGDVADIDLKAPAAITPLGGPPSKPVAHAQPVEAPPSASPLASSLDLFFEMPNPAAAFRPGQRLGVTLALKGDENNLVVPWSSIIHDYHGGSWVYVQTEPSKFVRRRVDLKHVQDDLAVLAAGPPVGTQVVIDGAAELFGIETGHAK